MFSKKSSQYIRPGKLTKFSLFLVLNIDVKAVESNPPRNYKTHLNWINKTKKITLLNRSVDKGICLSLSRQLEVCLASLEDDQGFHIEGCLVGLEI